ncbi:hypothetical protein ABZY16_01475 [Streptomyces sp. NPDC006553]|nr:hypothetical protein [Streptomyces sp. NBC_00233]MCX5232373.1 hypothetical protein [Streptomyces sp. NBC_00233]
MSGIQRSIAHVTVLLRRPGDGRARTVRHPAAPAAVPLTREGAS